MLTSFSLLFSFFSFFCGWGYLTLFVLSLFSFFFPTFPPTLIVSFFLLLLLFFILSSFFFSFSFHVTTTTTTTTTVSPILFCPPPPRAGQTFTTIAAPNNKTLTTAAAASPSSPQRQQPFTSATTSILKHTNKRVTEQVDTTRRDEGRVVSVGKHAAVLTTFYPPHLQPCSLSLDHDLRKSLSFSLDFRSLSLFLSLYRGVTIFP
ncbi:unnamed protein product [Acanthosepion pharaonis]|uniref:Uncharacterized protein n=1 Tax=Acanthosepion pharaonis TaxID=158019 RepID=A0A812DVV4_ACAPH|nr:unnamed protein product [Sepia pharaonis]